MMQFLDFYSITIWHLAHMAGACAYVTLSEVKPNWFMVLINQRQC